MRSHLVEAGKNVVIESNQVFESVKSSLHPIKKALVGPTDIWPSKEPHKGNGSVSYFSFACRQMFCLFNLSYLALKGIKIGL